MPAFWRRWGLQVVDYFTPYNQATLDSGDLDLGSGAPLILPDSAGDAAHQQLLVGAGKQGIIYLLDQNQMGKFSANQADELAAVVQEVPNVLKGVYDTPAYFNQQLYFVAAGTSPAMSFALPEGSAQIDPTPTSVSADTYGIRGATPSISSDGSENGIIWTIDTTTNQLRAYDATGFNDELYTSAQSAKHRDKLGYSIKFSVPTVANGYVYVGTSNRLDAYGLLNPPAAAP